MPALGFLPSAYLFGASGPPQDVIRTDLHRQRPLMRPTRQKAERVLALRTHEPFRERSEGALLSNYKLTTRCTKLRSAVRITTM